MHKHTRNAGARDRERGEIENEAKQHNSGGEGWVGALKTKRGGIV